MSTKKKQQLLVLEASAALSGFPEAGEHDVRIIEPKQPEAMMTQCDLGILKGVRPSPAGKKKHSAVGTHETQDDPTFKLCGVESYHHASYELKTLSNYKQTSSKCFSSPSLPLSLDVTPAATHAGENPNFPRTRWVQTSEGNSSPKNRPSPTDTSKLETIRKPRPAQVSKGDDDESNAKDHRRNPRVVKVTYPWRRGEEFLVHFFKHQSLRALRGGTSAAVGRLSTSFAASSLLLLLRLLLLRLNIAPIVCFVYWL